MPSTEEYFSGKFEKCPNPGCGNTHAGDGIHRCNDCGKIFCLDCGSPFTLSLFSEACPNCNGDSSYIGEIKQEPWAPAEDDSPEEISTDDDSPYEYTPSYSDPVPSHYTPSLTTVKKDKPGSGIGVLASLLFFLWLGFHLNKDDIPQKAAVSPTISSQNKTGAAVSGGTTANDTTLIGENEQSAESALASGGNDVVESSDNNKAPTIIGTVDVPSLKLLAAEAFPWSANGVVQYTQHQYDLDSGQQLDGLKVFVRFDDGTRTTVTLSHDFGFQSGEYLRVTYIDYNQVSLLRLVGD